MQDENEWPTGYGRQSHEKSSQLQQTAQQQQGANVKVGRAGPSHASPSGNVNGRQGGQDTGTGGPLPAHAPTSGDSGWQSRSAHEPGCQTPRQPLHQA